MTLRIIHTESGARYEARTVEGVYQIRRDRGESGNDKRRDGDWLRLLSPLPELSLVGLCLTLILEPLGSCGPDDDGQFGRPGPTIRVTTPVIYDSITEDNA